MLIKCFLIVLSYVSRFISLTFEFSAAPVALMLSTSTLKFCHGELTDMQVWFTEMKRIVL